MRTCCRVTSSGSDIDPNNSGAIARIRAQNTALVTALENIERGCQRVQEGLIKPTGAIDLIRRVAHAAIAVAKGKR